MHIKTIATLLGLGAAFNCAHAQETCASRGLNAQQCASVQMFCKTPDITAKDCNAYIALVVEEGRAAAAKQARLDKERADEEAWRASQLAAQAAQRAERDRLMEGDRQRVQAERDAEQERLQAERENEERASAQLEASLKAKCGADYLTLRVGMTLSRVQACVTDDLQAVGQAVTAKGTVTTYRIPSGYLRAMNGQVVQWGRFGPGQEAAPDLPTSQEPSPTKAVRPST